MLKIILDRKLDDINEERLIMTVSDISKFHLFISGPKIYSIIFDNCYDMTSTNLLNFLILNRDLFYKLSTISFDEPNASVISVLTLVFQTNGVQFTFSDNIFTISDSYINNAGPYLFWKRLDRELVKSYLV